jgi:Ras-related protein Rab-21
MLGQDIVLTIAGNKIDLERNRVVPLEKAEAYDSFFDLLQSTSFSFRESDFFFSFSLSFSRYAASVGAKHVSTSAKLNKGLNELFLDLAQSQNTVFFF